ncbi:hypothetical protein ADUPG1_009159, partial [Aduncisulcus paluster]
DTPESSKSQGIFGTIILEEEEVYASPSSSTRSSPILVPDEDERRVCNDLENNRTETGHLLFATQDKTYSSYITAIVHHRHFPSMNPKIMSEELTLPPLRRVILFKMLDFIHHYHENKGDSDDSSSCDILVTEPKLENWMASFLKSTKEISAFSNVKKTEQEHYFYLQTDSSSCVDPSSKMGIFLSQFPHLALPIFAFLSSIFSQEFMNNVILSLRSEFQFFWDDRIPIFWSKSSETEKKMEHDESERISTDSKRMEEKMEQTPIKLGHKQEEEEEEQVLSTNLVMKSLEWGLSLPSCSIIHSYLTPIIVTFLNSSRYIPNYVIDNRINLSVVKSEHNYFHFFEMFQCLFDCYSGDDSKKSIIPPLSQSRGDFYCRTPLESISLYDSQCMDAEEEDIADSDGGYSVEIIAKIIDWIKEVVMIRKDDLGSYRPFAIIILSTIINKLFSQYINRITSQEEASQTKIPLVQGVFQKIQKYVLGCLMTDDSIVDKRQDEGREMHIHIPKVCDNIYKIYSKSDLKQFAEEFSYSSDESKGTNNVVVALFAWILYMKIPYKIICDGADE